MNTSIAMSPPSSLSMNMNSSVRVHSPAKATPAVRAPKELAFRPKGIFPSLIKKKHFQFDFVTISILKFP